MKLFKTAILALTVHAMHITSPEATDNNDTPWMSHSHPSSSNLTSGVLPPGMPSKKELMKQLQAMFERKVVPVDPQQHLHSISTEELQNATRGFYSNNTPPQSQAMPQPEIELVHNNTQPHTLVLNPTQSEPELSHETSSTLVSTSDRGTPNPTQKKNKHPRKRPRE